jgi:hypothetical protein
MLFRETLPQSFLHLVGLRSEVNCWRADGAPIDVVSFLGEATKRAVTPQGATGRLVSRKMSLFWQKIEVISQCAF